MKKLINLNELQINSRICIYGTGHYGLALFQFLKKERPDIKIVKFIDTYRTGSIFGIDIISSDEVRACEPEFDYILIGSDAYRNEVINILEQRGFNNYYNISFNPIDVELPVNDYNISSSDFEVNLENHLYSDDTTSNSNNKVLYTFYDLSVYPGSFEIIDFLVLSDIEREERGLDSFHLVIVPKPNYLMSGQGKSSSSSFHTDDKELVNWRIKQILLPSAYLMSSCNGITVCSSRYEAKTLFSSNSFHKFPSDYRTDVSANMLTYIPSYFQRLNSFAQCSSIPSLEATKTAIDFVQDWIKFNNLADKKIVTLTLRDSPNYVKRNSTIEDWVKFAEGLDLNIFHPIFIKDTFTSFKSNIHNTSNKESGIKDNFNIMDKFIFYEASWNIELRMAIYELSYVNLFVSNGPAALCINNKKTSYIVFKMLNEEYNVTSPISYERIGFPVGSQYIQATPFQKIVWSSDDNYETILDEFNKFCKLKG